MQHHRHRLFCNAAPIGLNGRVSYKDTHVGTGIYIDVVDTDGVLADDTNVWRGLQDLAGDGRGTVGNADHAISALCHRDHLPVIVATGSMPMAEAKHRLAAGLPELGIHIPRRGEDEYFGHFLLL